MSIILIGSCILLVAGIIFMLSDNDSQDILFVMGIIFTFISIVFGFIVLGNLVPVKKEISIVEPKEILIGKNSVVVLINDEDKKEVVDNTMETYDLCKNKKIVVEKTCDINSYNTRINPPRYKIIEKTSSVGSN